MFLRRNQGAGQPNEGRPRGLWPPGHGTSHRVGYWFREPLFVEFLADGHEVRCSTLYGLGIELCKVRCERRQHSRVKSSHYLRHELVLAPARDEGTQLIL